ncbi:glycoside hydrolase family 18 [Alistipes sp.]|uniref:glycoside hydrolase family 18 n=1 Tax=Alistipes sp. TaxID=1872444 RepID=UPI003AEF42A3
MKRNIKHLLLPALALVTLSLASCSDWVEPESLDIKNPSLEEQNPALYAQYMESLKAYKGSDHKLLFVALENPEGTAPVQRNQHLTTLPDSVDFIVLNNPANLHPDYVKEMNEVRKKSTRVLYAMSMETYEAEWAKMLKADPKLTEEEALGYFGQRTREELALCDRYGFDGVIFGYTGRSLVSITEAEMEAYNARQKAYLDPVTAWRNSHKGKVFTFMGSADNLLPENRTILSECDHIVVPTDNAQNENDISLKALMVVQAEGVPADRIVVTALEIRPDDKDKVFGYFGTKDENGEKIRALYGAAVWATLPSPNFTRAGILVKDVEPDYYNRLHVYPHLREAISIMNPSPKN